MSVRESKTAAIGQDHGGEVNQTPRVYPASGSGSTPEATEEQIAWISRHIEALDLRAASEESLLRFRTLLGATMGTIDTERQRRDRDDFHKAMDQGVFDATYLPKPWERGR